MKDRMNPFVWGLFFCGGPRSAASVKAAKRFDAAEKSAPYEWIHPGDPETGGTQVSDCE
jgi:hypothetical protein